MPQVTIYLDQDTERRARREARAARMSLSRWIATILRERTAGEWPPEVLALFGAWPDFPSLEEIRRGQPPDTTREAL
jgi:hypothetical protein